MTSRGRLLAALALLAGAVAAPVIWHFQIYRLRPITADVYRSRQPGGRELRRAIEERGVNTVINLRGWNPKREWYRIEENVARQGGAELVNLPFETFDWPPRIETQRFVRAMSVVERPVLIHCATGVDRSGWAAAVVRLLEGDPLDAALAEMSRTRGHFCRIGRCPLHQFFRMYERWLAVGGRSHSAANFRHWVLEEYAPVPYDAEIHLTSRPQVAARAGEEIAFRALVTNRSPEPWITPLEPGSGIRLGVRVLGPFPQLPSNGLDLFRLPRAPARDVFRDNAYVGSWAPGSAREISVSFVAPEKPGHYLVQVDMVDELVHWFSDLGREGVVFALEIGPAGARSRPARESLSNSSV